MGRGDNRRTLKMKRKLSRRKFKIRVKKKMESASNK